VVSAAVERHDDVERQFAARHARELLAIVDG
jgi:hypothetical protein